IYRGSNFGRQEVNDEFAFAQLDKAVAKVEAIARQKEALVDKIKLAAEKAYKARSDNPPTGCYHRAKAVTLFPVVLGSNETQNCSEKLYLPLRENPLFENKYVSMNYSVAHVPTNVYDLSRELVTVGNWTAGLDKVFRENAASDRTLKWQYFGSSTGFFKYYPDSRNSQKCFQEFPTFFFQKHLDVVARSNALLNDAYTVWTGVSVGQFSLKETLIASKEDEPTMYTSVAKAVYDRTRKAVSPGVEKELILGLVLISMKLALFANLGCVKERKYKGRGI
ncbi:Voltage dependent calcium channel subunit, partial [Fasciola gigantica]